MQDNQGIGDIILGEETRFPIKKNGSGVTVLLHGEQELLEQVFIPANLSQFLSNYIVCTKDDKIIREYGRILSDTGYTVKILNLSDPSHSNSWNPFWNFSSDEDVDAFIGDMTSSYAEYFDRNMELEMKAAGRFLKSLFLYLIHDENDGGLRKPDTVSYMIELSRTNIRGEEIKDSDKTTMTKLDLLFEDVKRCSPASASAVQYAEYKKYSGRTSMSIPVVSREIFRPFTGTGMNELTATDEMQLDFFRQNPTAIFILNPEGGIHGELAPLFLSQLLRLSGYRSKQVIHGRSVLLFDDAEHPASLIPSVHDAMQRIASSGISFFVPNIDSENYPPESFDYAIELSDDGEKEQIYHGNGDAKSDTVYRCDQDGMFDDFRPYEPYLYQEMPEYARAHEEKDDESGPAENITDVFMSDGLKTVLDLAVEYIRENETADAEPADTGDEQEKAVTNERMHEAILTYQIRKIVEGHRTNGMWSQRPFIYFSCEAPTESLPDVAKGVYDVYRIPCVIFSQAAPENEEIVGFAYSPEGTELRISLADDMSKKNQAVVREIYDAMDGTYIKIAKGEEDRFRKTFASMVFIPPTEDGPETDVYEKYEMTEYEKNISRIPLCPLFFHEEGLTSEEAVRKAATIRSITKKPCVLVTDLDDGQISACLADNGQHFIDEFVSMKGFLKPVMRSRDMLSFLIDKDRYGKFRKYVERLSGPITDIGCLKNEFAEKHVFPNRKPAGNIIRIEKPRSSASPSTRKHFTHLHVETEQMSAQEGSVTNPIAVQQYIERSVIGQTDAVKAVSMAFTNHCLASLGSDLYPYEKEHVLIIGPSGCGKTEILRQLQRYIKTKTSIRMPLVFADASQMKADGWKGVSKGVTLLRLFTELGAQAPSRGMIDPPPSKETMSAVEHGIIVLDEFDKLVQPQYNGSGTNFSIYDQQSVLGMMDGTPVSLGDDGSVGTLNTEHLLFFMTGAFDTIYEKWEKDDGAVPLGFGAKVISGGEPLKDIRNDLMKETSMIPELVGRISTIILMGKTTEDVIYKAVVNSDSSCIRHYATLIEPEKMEIRYNPEYIRSIIREHKEDALGIRGIKNRINEIIKEKLYELYESGRHEIILDFDGQEHNDLVRVEPDRQETNGATENKDTRFMR